MADLQSTAENGANEQDWRSIGATGGEEPAVPGHRIAKNRQVRRTGARLVHLGLLRPLMEDIFTLGT